MANCEPCSNHTKFDWFCKGCYNERMKEYYRSVKHIKIECKVCKMQVQKVKLSRHMLRRDHLYHDKIE